MLMTSPNKHTVACENIQASEWKAMRYVILEKSGKWKTVSGSENNEFHV